VPVEGALSAVRVRTEVAVPPAGIVTGLCRLTVTPAGAAPDHEAPRLSCELYPFTDERMTVVDLNAPGVRLMVAGDGWEMKSGVMEEITTLPGVTFTSTTAECVIAPLDALTVNEYVPGATVPGTKMVSVGEDITSADV